MLQCVLTYYPVEKFTDDESDTVSATAPITMAGLAGIEKLIEDANATVSPAAPTIVAGPAGIAKLTRSTMLGELFDEYNVAGPGGIEKLIEFATLVDTEELTNDSV